MAVRYQCTFTSERGQYYDVQIHDVNYSGSVNDLILGMDGFSLSYTEIDSDRLNPILTSKCTIQLVVEKFMHDAFLHEIIYAEEDQYSIVIYRGDSSTSTDLFWVGYLLPDMITTPDKHYSYVAELNFYDTLGLLKDKSVSAVPESITFTDYIIEALGQLQQALFFQSTDEFVSFKVNWFEAEHSTVSTWCPLRYTRFNTGVFLNQNGSATEGISVYDSLIEICKAWNARLFFWNGLWHFDQINEIDDSSTYHHIYKKNGTWSRKTTVIAAISLVSGDKFAGGSSTYLPAFREIQLSYKYTQGVTTNLLPSQSSYSSYTEMGAIDGTAEDTYMHLDCGMFINYNGGSVGEAFRAKFRMYIKLDSSSSTDYYLRYADNFSWTSTSSYIDFITPVYQTGSGVGFTANYVIQFITRQIPDAYFAASRFKFELVGYECLSSTGNWISFTPSGTFSYNEPFYIYLEGENTGTEGEINFSAKNNDASAVLRDYSEIHTREVLLGDGPTSSSLGKLETATYSEIWTDATEWKRDSVPSGDGVNFNELAAVEILAGQKEIREVYASIIRNKYLSPLTYFEKTWHTNTSRFAFLSGELDAKHDEWRGNWFEVKYTRTDVGTTWVINPNVEITAQTVFNYAPDSMPQAQFIKVLQMIAITYTSASTSGTKTSISIGAAGADMAKSGETLTIINPYNLENEEFTLSADHDASDTSLSISSKTFTNTYPSGSIIIQTIKQIRGLARAFQDA